MTHPRILIVEDEIVVARDIQAHLEDRGYLPVGHAFTGEEAIALTGALRPDLVLMDIQLTGPMDGIVAAQAIHDQFFIPVVFVSAFAADAIIARAKLTEPYGYVLKPFSERELNTAIEMALYKHAAEVKLHANARQLQALSQRVLEVQESERRRFAIELHDDVGQCLTAIKINLQAGHRIKDQTVESLRADNLPIVEEALLRVRRMAAALRPPMLDELGLLPALRWMGKQAASRSGFEFRCDESAAADGARLVPEVEISFFRIAQEALTNIERHAHATQVVVCLRHDGNLLTLTVQDNGCGFDPAAVQGRALAGDGIGLLGMHERALLIQAQLDLASRPGHGSTVCLRYPLCRLP
ncbi:MAG: response regulator [Rhodoferax sp.]|nr:response regulator [Rhodoferax sp.]MCF8209644.1 response regulator [Rhodoferax sp.]